MPETSPRGRRGRLSFGSAARGYASVLADSNFRTNALQLGLANAALAAFFSGAPDLMITHLGVSPAEFGLFPPVSIVGFRLSALVIMRAADRLSARALVAGSAAVMAVGAVGLLAPALLSRPTAAGLVVAMAVIVFGFGLLFPTATAEAMRNQEDEAGSATALLSIVEMTCGAAGAAMVGILQADLPLAALQIVMAGVVALLCVSIATPPLKLSNAT